MSRIPTQEDEVMAAADKEMEERANRAKQLLSQRYKGLRNDQVRITQCSFIWECLDLSKVLT